MTRDPEPPDAKDPEPPHHGLVEEIREEIEHVVEHVPKPVRWTVRKLALVIALGIGGLVVITVAAVLLYFANRTELLAKELVVLINGTLAQRTDVALEFDDIRGNPLSEVRLLRSRVRFRDDQGPVLLESPSIRLRYSGWGLLTGSARAIDVDIESPVITLGRRADGKLRLPVWKSSGKPPARGGGFDVRLRLRGGRFVAPGPLDRLEGVDLMASVSIASGTHVKLDRLAWERGFYETRDLELAGELTAGDSVQFVVQRLSTPDFRLRGRGGWKKGSAERTVHAEVEGLRWRWLAGITKNRTLEVPGEGAFVVDARGDQAWNGQFTSRLNWNGADVRGGGRFTWADQRLKLAPLNAASKAGLLEGEVGWSKQGWYVTGQVTGADPEQWSVIGITGWPQGRLDGTMRYQVDTRRAPEARLDAELAPSELAGWRADRADVVVRFPAVGPDSFTVAMERRGGRMVLLGASNPGGWQGSWTAEGLPLEEWPDGRASGLSGTLDRAAGTVVGIDGRLEVEGSLAGLGTQWLGARMARWSLPAFKGVLLPKPDLEIKVWLVETDFLGLRFDSTALDLQLIDQSARLDAIEAHASDTVVTLAGAASWTPAGWRMTLDRAAARSTQFAWTAEPPVLLSGDKAGVVFDRLRARDGDAAIEVTGRWASPGGRYDWRMRADALDLSRLGLPSELALEGRLDGTLEVRGVSGDPRWTFEGGFGALGWQGHRIDTLQLALSGAPSMLDVRQARLGLGGGALTAAVRFEGTREPWPATLDAARVQEWLITAGGWRGNARAEAFPLAELERIAPQARGWSGELSGSVEIAGSPVRPELVAQADIKALAWQGYRFDDVTADLAYAPSRLDVRELELARGNLVSTIRGALPLALELGKPPEVLEAPMSWTVQVPNGDLAVLPVFVPQFGSAAGKFEVDARVGGTPRHPDLAGTLRIRDGELRMAGREETLDHVDADFSLDESRITLDSLSARQGVRGRVEARGAVELAGGAFKGYAFDVRMREFTALETGLYAAQFDGDFRVTNGPRIDRQILPHVEGRADVRRAVILFDFANQTEMQKIAASTAPLFWTYRIQVNANSGLRWQPPDGDIEFNANLSLEQNLNELIIYGEMHALRGTYYFLSNRFTVKQADLTFDNVEGVNPMIEAEATTRIRTAGLAPSGTVVSSTAPESYEITVRISGRADEPAIEFASNPSDLDENAILRELTLVRPLTEGGAAALGDPVDNYLTRAINKTLSAEMSRVFQGYVNEWEIQRTGGGILGGEGDVYLSVGSQITPNVLLRYRQRLPGTGRQSSSTADPLTNPFERDVEAEFRLNRFFYITSEVSQRRTLGGSTTTRSGAADFNLNLKARWEY